MRLLGSLMLPAWVQRPGDGHSLLNVSTVQQAMTLFGMAFFSLAAVVRTPLHAVVQLLSFLITVGGYGIAVHLPWRLAVTVSNLLLVAVMERSSRRHFIAQRARAGKRD